MGCGGDGKYVNGTGSDGKERAECFLNSVIHEKPRFVKRTRDKMWFSDLETMPEILQAYKFTARKYIEEDGSVTLSLNEIDFIENGANEQEARLKVGQSIEE